MINLALVAMDEHGVVAGVKDDREGGHNLLVRDCNTGQLQGRLQIELGGLTLDEGLLRDRREEDQILICTGSASGVGPEEVPCCQECQTGRT